MSDRIAVMNAGVIEQLGTPEAVYERPRTTFVAGFIGVSNLMPGQVVSANGSGASLRLDSGLVLQSAETRDLHDGERCHAVVRPEKLELHPVEEPAPGGRPSLEGLVVSSLYLGSATQVVVQLPGEVAMTVLVPNSDYDARRRLPVPGDPVRLSWADEHMHLVRESAGDLGPAIDKTETTAPAGAI
jgi:spermidine/putrescine transport system ATP-binding protein